MSFRITAALLSAAIGLSACENVPSTPSATAMLGLHMGDRGEGVAALNAHLTRYGYFENAELRRTFPSWRPVSVLSPDDPAVFGPATEQGLRAYQRLGGLPVTGVVDEPTLARLDAPRCQVPDSDPTRARDKWDVKDIKWNKTFLNYRVVTPLGSPVSAANFQNAVTAALNTWLGVIPQVFFLTTASTADITFTFANLGEPLGVVAGTTGNPNTPVLVQFNNRTSWSTDPFTPPTGLVFDVQSVATHEIGHALGLEHSSIFDSAMNSQVSSGFNRTIRDDDRNAIAGLYSQLVSLPGQARDIGVGADGSAWVIGSNAVGGGFSIHRFDPSINNWRQVDGGAVRITVDNTGAAWVVNNSHAIFKWNGSFFQPIPGSANDIGAGADGSVWIIGTQPRGGGFSIERYIPRLNTFLEVGGGAVRIAADAGGRAWVINNGNGIFRWNTNSGVFDQLPGLGVDIAVAADGEAYVLGVNSIGSDFGLFIWNEQGSLPSGEPPPRAQARWLPIPGQGVSVAAGPDGTPWVTAANLAISRQLRQ